MAIQDIDLGTVIENGEDGDVARTAFTKVNENFDDLDARVTYIESLDIGTVTSVNDVLPVDGNVDLTPADIGAATAAQGAKADTAVQTDVFATALNQKVDKVEGYQLSQEDYTTEEKNKLAGLESSLFLGVYGSLAELEAAHPTSDRPGEYAFIPAGSNIYMFVWDADTERWVTIGSGSEAITAEQVKTLYESNPNTNTFTDAEKTKLSDIQAGAQVNVATNISQGTRTDTTVNINSSTGTGATLVGASTTEAGVMTAADKVKLTNIQAGATANQTDAYLLNRANHTGTQPISSVTNLQTSLDSKQATLVSGTNIKTINGESVLGSGDLSIAGGAISKSYVSPQQTITTAGSLALNHGLGEIPKIVGIELVCLVAENGYSVGDVVDQTMFSYANTTAQSRNCAVTKNSTQLYITFSNVPGAVFVAPNKSTGSLVGLNNTNWALVARAFA